MNKNITVNCRTFLRNFKKIKQQLYCGEVQVIIIPDEKEQKSLELMVHKESFNNLKESCQYLRKKGKAERVKKVNLLSAKNIFPHVK